MWNNNIPRFKTGGQYIPGLESSIFGAKLDRSVADTQEDLRNKAKRMQKGLFRGKIGRLLGKGAGKWLGKALTAGIAATNPLAALALSSGISAGTQRIAEKIGRGKDVKLRNTSGLLGSQYDDLKDYQKGADKASKGAAWETFGEEIFGGLKSDYGQKIWGDQLSDDFKTKVFGKNLGSKTHEELSKMNIGEMLGTKGAFFGAEDKLSDVGKEAYDWAGDLYRGIKGENPYTSDINPLKWLGKFNQQRYQDGGIVGYQEGGIRRAPDSVSPQEVDMDDVLKRKTLMDRYSNVFNQELDRSDRIANYTKARRQMDLSSGLYAETPDDSAFTAVGGLTGQRGNLTDEEYFGGMRNLEAEQEMLRDMFRSSLTSQQGEGMQSGGMAYPLQMAGGGYTPEQGIGGLIQYRKGY